MNLTPWKPKPIIEDDVEELATSIATALSDKLNEQPGQMVVIGKIDVNVNMATGGGAKVVVNSPGDKCPES